MKNNTKYIFISNGYKGGATKFQEQHMNYLLKKNKKILLIDDNPKKTYENLNNKIEVHKVKINQANKNSKTKLEKIICNNLEKNIIFITNYAFLIKYFKILNKFKDKNKNNKIILTIHSGILDINIKNYIAGFIFSFVYKMANKIYFGSNSARYWWKRKFPWMKIEKSKIFFNGVEITKKLKTKKIKKKTQISFVGRFEKENDPLFFLQIAQNYQLKHKDCYFNMFGSGRLYQTIKNKNKSDRIRLFGWQKKNYIYRNTDILLITSPVNNFPYVALEAKSNGIPVITCSKGDIKKIIKHNNDGLINYTKSSEIMSKLINIVLEKYSFFSNNALKRSKMFDVNKSCRDFWKYTNE